MSRVKMVENGVEKGKERGLYGGRGQGRGVEWKEDEHSERNGGMAKGEGGEMEDMKQ